MKGNGQKDRDPPFEGQGMGERAPSDRGPSTEGQREEIRDHP